ncbi:MAG: adenylate/guanylate cyclase domain-containing protein [Myxococcaceae bacterium]
MAPPAEQPSDPEETPRSLERENQRLKGEVDRLTRELETVRGKSSQTIVGLSDCLITADAEGKITYLNSAAEKHYGVRREETLGKPVRVLPTLVSGELLEKWLAEARAAQAPVERELSSEAGATGPLRAFQIKVQWLEHGAQILITDRSELKQLEQTFSRYLSPSVLEAVLKSGMDPFRARKYELTVLFADLRGFTSMSSRLPAEQVKALIDEYLTVQIDVVLSAGATLDKLVGDEVMALFGAPLPAEDHALWAIDTALRMREGHRRLMEIWQRRSLVGCELGIGINTGEMVVGNIGSRRRMDFTVLGHHVNLGARLCSGAKGGEIVMSRRTFEQAKESLTRHPEKICRPVKFRRGEAIVAKGIREPVETIQVIDS